MHIWGSSSSALHTQKSEPPASAVEQASEAEVEKGQNFDNNDNDSDSGSDDEEATEGLNTNNNTSIHKKNATHNKKAKKKSGKGKAKKKGHRHTSSHTYNSTTISYDTSDNNLSLLTSIACNEKVNVVHALHDVASVDCPSTVLVADAVSSDVYVYTIR